MGCTLSKTNLDKAIFYNFEDLCELKYDKKNIYIGNLIIPKNDITNFFISKDVLFIISILDKPYVFMMNYNDLLYTDLKKSNIKKKTFLLNE